MQPTVIDLYCGAGGASTGFQEAGFKVLLGVDLDKFALETFSLNHPGATVLLQDVLTVDYPALKTAMVWIACCPCQGFSRSQTTKENDGRRRLVVETVRLFLKYKRPVLFMENVVPFRDSPECAEATRLLEEAGYLVHIKVLDFVDYGLPQKRRRTILIASRVEFRWPDTTHSEEPDLFTKRWRTVGDAFEGLPPLTPGQVLSPMDRCRNLSPVLMKRILHTPEGGNWRDWPDEILEGRFLKWVQDNVRGFPEAFARMHRARPSATVRTEFMTIKGWRGIHYEEDRGISLREGARLQSFPDDHKFHGSPEQIQKQVGNAVPPHIAKLLAINIKKLLKALT